MPPNVDNEKRISEKRNENGTGLEKNATAVVGRTLNIGELGSTSTYKLCCSSSRANTEEKWNRKMRMLEWSMMLGV